MAAAKYGGQGVDTDSFQITLTIFRTFALSVYSARCVPAAARLFTQEAHRDSEEARDSGVNVSLLRHWRSRLVCEGEPTVAFRAFRQMRCSADGD